MVRAGVWTCIRDRRLAETISSAHPIEKERKKDRVKEHKDKDVVKRCSRISVSGNINWFYPKM